MAKNWAINVILYSSIKPFFFESKFFKIIAQRKLTKGIDINNIIIIREINNSKLIKIKERDSTVNFSLFIRYTRIRITAKNFNNKTAPVYFLFFNFFNQEKIAFYNPLAIPYFDPLLLNKNYLWLGYLNHYP